MIIDFHTHVFPDKIAHKTIAYLAGKAGITPFSDGTCEGLMQRISEAGADVAVNLPVLTSPSQFESVNRFALEINKRFAQSGRGIISFAGIHPDCDDVDTKMRLIKEQGFIGIKLHPDYQETYIDDEKYIRIIECAKENDLVTVVHSGVDGGYPGQPVRCTPERALKVIDRVRHSKLVLAHLGANEMAEEVIDLICGKNVYLDTAYVLRYTDRDTFMRVLERHGEDRILFASDSPWSSIEKDVEILRSLSLGKDTEEKIFSRNAASLLGL